MKTSPREIAERFRAACAADGWTIARAGAVVTIEKHFTPGDRAAFCAADSEGYSLLAMLPARGGSTWGTDGGSIGGHVALTNGHYTLNVSGVGARVAAALAR